MRVALIASARFPIREPFAGGLEAHSWSLARGLTELGHKVSVFAGRDSDPRFDIHNLGVRTLLISELARSDVSMTPQWWLEEHHAYLALMLDLAHGGGMGFDIIHNNSLHYLPIAMAAMLPVPVVTTLHTPPTPWLESAIQAPRGCPVTFAAVSAHTAQMWQHLVPRAQIVRNGVDLNRWRLGSGGGPAIWSGRLVPEKGAHLAAEAAAKAGIDLYLAGPIPDADYVNDCIQPWLGPRVSYVGHLASRDLSALVGQACVSVATPIWEEPFGLVVAESMACGTPVAGFARGALPELIGNRGGVLAAAGDVDALAAAMQKARLMDRRRVRAHALDTCSVQSMLRGYEEMYRQLLARQAA
jgi:glycosyltransferase involved in cell wall biosynthesis